MTLDNVLSQFIEGYLFADLETMRAAAPSRGADGNLGYPMLMSCAGGIELLGILASENPFNQRDPAGNFRRYWTRFLYPTGPRRNAGDAVYQLVRHGLAHNFAAKIPFKVEKGGGHHLVWDSAHAEVFIDPVQLFSDLRDSYVAAFRPVAVGRATGPADVDSRSMEQRLDELIAANAQALANHGAKLGPLPSISSGGGGTPMPGGGGVPSGSLPPVPATSSGIR